jgi:hypothetical protein
MCPDEFADDGMYQALAFRTERQRLPPVRPRPDRLLQVALQRCLTRHKVG